MPKKVCLVIPCYNEGARLNSHEFKKYQERYYFIFVNDGSKDNTIDILNRLKSENVYILNLKQNGGKAEAIRQGMTGMLGALECSKAVLHQQSSQAGQTVKQLNVQFLQ